MVVEYNWIVTINRKIMNTDAINSLLSEISAAAVEERIEMMYDDFIHALLYLQEQETYSVHSYGEFI